jgi:hypothetical protein
MSLYNLKEKQISISTKVWFYSILDTLTVIFLIQFVSDYHIVFSWSTILLICSTSEWPLT